MAQKNPKGHTINISGETIEIEIPGKNKQVEGKNQTDEIVICFNTI